MEQNNFEPTKNSSLMDDAPGCSKDLPTTSNGKSENDSEFRDRLRTWLVNQLNSNSIPDLVWLNSEKTIFKVPWKHAGRQDYQLEDSRVFMEWAKHSGRFREGVDQPEPIVWKTRLRCALNKMSDVRELQGKSRLDHDNPYRVYELLPTVVKKSRIRKRVPRSSKKIQPIAMKRDWHTAISEKPTTSVSPIFNVTPNVLTLANTFDNTSQRNLFNRATINLNNNLMIPLASNFNTNPLNLNFSAQLLQQQQQQAVNSMFPFSFLPNQNVIMSNVLANQTLNSLLAYQALMPKIAQQSTLYSEANPFGQGTSQITPINSIDSTASVIKEQVGMQTEQIQNRNTNSMDFYRQQTGHMALIGVQKARAKKAVEHLKRNLSKIIEQQVKDRFEAAVNVQNKTNISGRQRPKLVRQERIEEEPQQNQISAAWHPPVVRQERLTSTGITRDNSMEVQENGSPKQQNSDISQFYLHQ